MDIYFIIHRDHTISFLSRPPVSCLRNPGEHCFYCSGFLSIETLRNFISSAISYIHSGNIQFVTTEGFTLIY